MRLTHLTPGSSEGSYAFLPPLAPAQSLMRPGKGETAKVAGGEPKTVERGARERERGDAWDKSDSSQEGAGQHGNRSLIRS